MNPQKVREVTPLEIAPEEIWMYIFDLLEANDLVDVSLSCRSFSNFLRKKKVTFLVRNVLPIIARYLYRSSMIACRGVSKRWRVETDMFLDSRAFTEMYGLDDKTRQKRNSARFLCPLLIFDMERMAQFHQSMKDHPTNPFVSRTVNLDLKEGDFGPAVKDTVQLFIDTFGQHIWHFDYYDQSEPENIENIMTLDGAYRLFKNIADAMPNLRSIYFAVKKLKNSGAGPGDEIQGVNPLIDLMAASPLPKLTFLEMLTLEFGDSFSLQENELSLHCPNQCDEIYDKIFLAYGQQLHRLEINWYYWNPLFLMENLTELQLNFFETNNSLEWINNRFTSNRPSFTELSLPSLVRLDISFSYCKVDIDRFMIFLQNAREICGRFEILNVELYIPPVRADRDGTAVEQDFVLAEKPDEYDSELEWLRYMITEFVNECMSP